jgi:hypothetical protein
MERKKKHSTYEAKIFKEWIIDVSESITFYHSLVLMFVSFQANKKPPLSCIKGPSSTGLWYWKNTIAK